jgi:hypothetical protein
LKNTEVAQIVWLLSRTVTAFLLILTKKNDWATFWAISYKTHLATQEPILRLLKFTTTTTALCKARPFLKMKKTFSFSKRIRLLVALKIFTPLAMQLTIVGLAPLVSLLAERFGQMHSDR